MHRTLGDRDLVAGFDDTMLPRYAHRQPTIDDRHQLIAVMDKVIPLAPRRIYKAVTGVTATLPIIGNGALRDGQREFGLLEQPHNRCISQSLPR